MRRTVSAEMLETTPSRTNCRAISVQSHCDRERLSSSGRSQAILTTYIATSGGKGRLAAAPGAIVQAGQAALEEPLDPLADMLLGQADQPGHGDQGCALGDFEDGPASPRQSQGGRRAAQGLQELIVFFQG
jgi:hypothetical protein